MRRRAFLQSLALAGGMAGLPLGIRQAFANAKKAVSVEQLPPLVGDLTLYLGRGEGGLYEKILKAIEERNPKLSLKIRRGPSAALANTLVAEAKAGVRRADLFWAVDSGAIGMVRDAGLAQPIPESLNEQLQPNFRYPQWVPVSGRIRTLPYNPQRLQAAKIPKSILALADSKVSVAWAPAYASFQSFVTAMRILEGEDTTKNWLRAMSEKATTYAGELGVVMAVERGEVDLGLANHYYTLRLQSGKPKANVDLAFTNNDAGCLVNASGILALNPSDTAQNFIRYLLTREVQSFLASEAFEIPLVQGVQQVAGLPKLEGIAPPKIDLTRLADMRPTLKLLRDARLL